MPKLQLPLRAAAAPINHARRVLLQGSLLLAAPFSACAVRPPVQPITSLIPRDLSIADHPGAPDLSKADSDCVPMAAAGKVAEVKEWLLASSASDMTRCTLDLPLRDAYLQVTPWLSRAISAYAPLRADISASDRQRIDSWLIRNAEFNCTHMDYNLAKIFPNRAQDDYSVRARDAKSGVLTNKRVSQNGAPISVLSQWYNNRRSSTILYVVQAGVMYQHQPFINSAKRYIQEWIRYSVFSGGEQGEWLRNGDYGYVSAGLIYGASNIAVALLTAMWLSDLGDESLLHYETNDGLYGTESPSHKKTIWTAFDTHVALLDGSLQMRDMLGRPFDPLLTPYGRPNHPSWYLPAARRYQKSQSLDAWALASEKAPKLDDPFGKWRGICGIYTDVRKA